MLHRLQVVAFIGLILVAANYILLTSNVPSSLLDTMENNNHKRKRRMRKKAKSSGKADAVKELSNSRSRRCNEMEKAAGDTTITCIKSVTEATTSSDPCQNRPNSCQLTRSMSLSKAVADLIMDEVIAKAVREVDQPKTFDQLFEPSSEPEEGGEAVDEERPEQHLIVHRGHVDPEGNSCDEVMGRLSSVEGGGHDDSAERMEELEHEVSTLQECLEIAEAHVDKVEAELLKEKSKVELIERELKSREQMMRLILSEKSRQLNEAVSRAEAAEKRAYDDQLNHHDQLEMYQAQLREKEAETTEKEESNQMLRRDMLEIMNRFNEEKAAVEAKMEEAKAVLVAKLTAEAQPLTKDMEKRLKVKHAEVRALQKEVIKLRGELDIHQRTSDRAKRIALILDAIDSID